MSTLQAEEDRSIAQQLETTLDPEWVRAFITRETHNWGFWLLVMGFAQLIARNWLDPVWGVVLILIGAASFYFHSAAMLPVYAVTMVWAMVSNISSGDVRWIGFGLLQGYWAFTTLNRFLSLRHATKRLAIGLCADAASASDRAEVIFPWAGCVLSAVSVLGLVVLIVAIIVASVLTEIEPSDQMLNLIYAGLVDAACLGLALGAAALLARFRWQAVSVLAVLASGLMLGFSLVLVFLP